MICLMPALCALTSLSPAANEPAIVRAAGAAAQRPRRVAVVVFDGVALLDFAGPQYALDHAGMMWKLGGRPAFEVVTVAPRPGPVRVVGGPAVLPDRALSDAMEADIVIVPGGHVGTLLDDAAAMERLKALCRRAEICISVCNGATVLGEFGLLDGIEATSTVNEGLRRQFPRARVVDGVRCVDAGAVITTGSAATGIDAALRVVQRVLGADRAGLLAQHLAFPWSPTSTATTGDAAGAAVGTATAPTRNTSPATAEHDLTGDLPNRARGLYLGAIEKCALDGEPRAAVRWIRGALEAGYPKPSDALAESAFEPLRRDPELRRELRDLLAAHARESEVRMVGSAEPGKPMRLDLEFVDSESGAPISDARIYLYQTDDEGLYAPEAPEPGGGSDNPRLFAYARTDASGRARILGIVPGAYRGTQAARHVHLRIKPAAARTMGTTIYFDGNPPADDEVREEAASGRATITRLAEKDGVHHAVVRIRVPAK